MAAASAAAAVASAVDVAAAAFAVDATFVAAARAVNLQHIVDRILVDTMQVDCGCQVVDLVTQE